MIRHWDPENRYVGAALTNYRYWAIEVSWRQHTLGSCIMFCRREGVRLLSELTDEELSDMRDAMAAHEMRLRTRSAFRPDHINYLQMGNVLLPLHLHIVPRYKTTRTSFGREWSDSAWGKPPAWSSEEISHTLMAQIRDAFAP
jgi:diadenosine tetraphosphate (Ap4A) HIT family hydrolase